MTFMGYIISKYQSTEGYEKYLWGIFARRSAVKTLGGYYGWLFTGIQQES